MNKIPIVNEDIRIIVVDDEIDILEILKYNLIKEGYQVITSNNGTNALSLIREWNPHLAILDVMMPGMDGIELCAHIRLLETSKDMLICFLTARSESDTHISALDSGGDDFISKPIKPQVFISRIKALLRRHPNLQSNKIREILEFGNLTIDYDQYIVTLNGTNISLAKKELDLLKLLTSKPGKVFGRSEILSKVWGANVIVGDRTIDVHIRKLREKIGSHFIRTIKGVGYKFDF